MIENIKGKLPKEEKAVEKFYQSCEIRKKYVESKSDFADKHLKKAKHDLYRATREFEDKCWDWTVIKAYYAIHHAGNALLLKKKGFFCKDHYCLIVALKYHNLIKDELFNELSKLHESFADTLGLDLTFQLRKMSQYDVNEWENVKESDASLIVSVAKKFVSFVENEK